MIFSLVLISKNRKWNCQPTSAITLSPPHTYIWECCIWFIYCMIYMSHFLHPFLCFLLPFSFLTKMLSLNHPSAFLDRRRYYETYVRYVVFLGLAPAVCLNSKRRTFFLYLFVSFWLGFGSMNGCILDKSVSCAICWPAISQVTSCLCCDAVVSML